MQPLFPHQQAGPGRSSSRVHGSGLCPHSPAIAFGPVRSVPVHDDSAAGTGPDDDAEDARGTGRRAVARLGKGEAVRVVGEAHVPPEEASEVLAQRPAEEPRGVRVLHEACRGRDRARHPDADHPARAERGLDLGDEARDRRESAVVVGRRRTSQTEKLAASVAEGQRLGLCPAEVDADPHFPRFFSRKSQISFRDSFANGVSIRLKECPAGASL